MNDSYFDDIRSYRDEEVPAAIARILSSKKLEPLLSPFLGSQEVTQLMETLPEIKTIYDFQFNIIKKLLDGVLNRAGAQLYSRNIDIFDTSKGCLFVSNHRDIVLDPTFLGYLFLDKGILTAEVAIGNNLLIEPWIEDIVKLNRSFIVKRDVQGRELLLSSQKISAYIRHVIAVKHANVWIAQREGRAKDGNDATQSSLLKMLHFSAESKSLIDGFDELRIVPVSISYEFDPCDVLKAKELYLHSVGIDFQKSPYDDLLSMKWGLLGLRGRVCYSFSREINNKEIRDYKDNQTFVDSLAAMIDQRIYASYELFPSHFYCFDKFHSLKRFDHKYSEDDGVLFEKILDNKIKLLLPEFIDNQDFRQHVYLQYANVLKNALTVNPMLIRK